MKMVERRVKINKRSFLVLSLIVISLLVLAGCGGSDTKDTAVPEGVTSESPVESGVPVEMPETNGIGTAESPLTTPAPQTTDDDFLAIDEILDDIDNDVCQSAYETKLELEALISEGVDVAELETAVEELIEELENCPTPTPTSQP